MKNTYSLKNEHHDFNIERFKARLMGKCCVVFICMVQIIIRIIILATEPKLDHRSRVAHVISLPFVFLIAVIIVFEYILFRKIGPKVMNYSKLIDIILIVLFTIEWLITLFIIFIRFGNMNPPSLSPSAVFAITNFGWRTLFLLFLIQGWKLIILPPTIAMFFTLGFTLYYSTTGPKLILMASLSQILYTIIMLYFLDKIKWKEIFTNAQQERWMQINQFVLNNIPENIVILELGGGVNFISDYCKAFMDSVHLSSNPQDLFTHITQLYLLSENQPTSPCNTSRQYERATTFNILPDPADVSIQMPSAKKVDTLQDLIENFKTLINQSRLQEKEFLIYNGKLQVEDHHVKSIEIKISFMQQYAQDFIILIIRDTTHRDLLVTLEETNKYKDQLLASVSHELRAPLNGNINLLESALQEKSIPTRIKDGLLTPAVRSSKFLLHLINDILDMSQIKAQKLRLIFKPGKLQETLKDTLQLVELHAKKKGLELCLNIHPEIIRSSVCTDHVRLSQIVLNLLNNAIKFTQKGSIVLSAMPTDDPMLLKISVQDSGMGMAQESIKKLFLDYTHIEFAERKEINPTGVGLGLSIAYNLAKLLGPQTQRGITVESVLSVGSTFSFLIENKIDRLETQDVLTNKSGSDRSSRFIVDELESFQPKNTPRLSQCLSMNVLSQHVPSNPPNNEKLTKCNCAKILIVDDNPFNTMAFDAVLGALNFRCDSVFNGQSAIEKIIERQTTFCGINCRPYSVVFMDQEMPGMTGSETVEEIRKLEIQGLVSPMRVVGCTAHGSTEEVERFMQSGLDMCIHKPITASEIQKILKCEDLSSP